MANTELYKDYTPWKTLEQSLPTPNPLMDNFQAAPTSWQKLNPWTKKDWERLGIGSTMQRIADSTSSNTPLTDGGRSYDV
jgi:hypothetical protein